MRKAIVILFCASVMLVTLACSHAVGSETTFTLVVIPDTQREIKSKPGVFYNRMQWIKAAKDEYNIKAVLHTGDLVDWDTPEHGMYQTASTGFAYLDDVSLPYAISPGNHDTGAVDVGGGAKPPPNDAHVNVRDTTTFNSYFPLSRFRSLGGVYEAKKEDNSYHTFTAGGVNWLVISLEFCARTGPINWAKTVVQNHPNHNVIFITHYYLEGNGTISQSNAGYGDNSAQYVFDNLVKQYPNVRMVFSGHVGIHSYSTSTGVHGNKIYNFLGTYHDTDVNPTRLLEIDTVNGWIKTRVYMPINNRDKADGSARTITGINWVKPAITTKPAAPTTLAATAASTSQINLTWKDNATNESGFKIERKTGSAGTWSQIATTTANVVSFSNSGLSAATQYFYRVRANNSGGDSAYSNEASATTHTPPATPAAPSNLVASAVSPTQIRLNWNDNSGNETGFKLEGKTGAAGTWSQIALLAAGTTSFNGSNLKASTQYFFRVRATNAAGNSGYSNEASVTTLAAPAGTGTGLRGEYFGNANFTGFELSRVDSTINFNWGSGSPDPAIDADTFSVRWTGQIQAQFSETYTFYTNTDDGVRLWVNDKLLVNVWVDQPPTEWSGTIGLTAGQKYSIKFEYYENGVGAAAQLLWASPSTNKGIVPKSQLYPAAANTAPVFASGPSATPNPATTNDTVSFSATATDANNDTLAYTWNFGDGTSSSGASTTHKYGTAGNYSATVSVHDNRGGTISANVPVTITAPPPPMNIRVNFQMAGSATPAGHLADAGAVFGSRGNGYTYGWNSDNSTTARDRNAANSPDQRYDTLQHMHKPENPDAWWQIAVPNGTYTVRVVCGDPSYFDSIYKINVEDVLVVNATPTATAKWFEGTKTVTVSDGRLTVGSAAGSINNKLCFIEISNGVVARELAADAPEAGVLAVSRLQLGMNFAKSGKDGYRVSGSIPNLPADFATGGLNASIDVGAAIADFKLDSKGRAKTKSGSMLLKFNPKKGWQYQATLKSGAWSDEWSDGGLKNQTVTKFNTELPVTLTIGGQVYGGSKQVVYQALEKKSGAAK